jgi:hypothetical protein
MPFINLKNVGPSVLEAHIPLATRLDLNDLLVERQQRLNATHRELSAGLARLHEEYRRRVREMVGEQRYQENLPRYRELLGRFAAQAERKALTPENDRTARELRRALAAEKHAFYHGLGIDLPQVIQMRDDAVVAARRLVEHSLQRDLEMPAEDVPEPEPTDNPWSWRYPPYANQWGAIVSSFGTGGDIWRSANANAKTGDIHLESWIQLYGADDSDTLNTDAMCEVGFWFQMPAAGMLEVWAYFQDINSDYNGFLYDESGCSDADVLQLSRLYLWTGGSTERYVPVVEVKRGEDDEGPWAENFTTPGTVIARHFFSQKAYAAGEWVYGAIGVKDFNYFWVDDMTCRSRIVSQWFVKQIAVRSTGAP